MDKGQMQRTQTPRAEIDEGDRHCIVFYPRYESEAEWDRATEADEVSRIFEEAASWLKQHQNFTLHDVAYFCQEHEAMFLTLYGEFEQQRKGQ